MSDERWTIERIREALGEGPLSHRFLTEIYQAPAPALLAVFAKWEQIATDVLAAVEQGREVAAYDARGEEPPGEWIDATDRIRTEAARIRAQGAA